MQNLDQLLKIYARGTAELTLPKIWQLAQANITPATDTVADLNETWKNTYTPEQRVSLVKILETVKPEQEVRVEKRIREGPVFGFPVIYVEINTPLLPETAEGRLNWGFDELEFKRERYVIAQDGTVTPCPEPDRFELVEKLYRADYSMLAQRLEAAGVDLRHYFYNMLTGRIHSNAKCGSEDEADTSQMLGQASMVFTLIKQGILPCNVGNGPHELSDDKPVVPCGSHCFKSEEERIAAADWFRGLLREIAQLTPVTPDYRRQRPDLGPKPYIPGSSSSASPTVLRGPDGIVLPRTKHVSLYLYEHPAEPLRVRDGPGYGLFLDFDFMYAYTGNGKNPYGSGEDIGLFITLRPVPMTPLRGLSVVFGKASGLVYSAEPLGRWDDYPTGRWTESLEVSLDNNPYVRLRWSARALDNLIGKAHLSGGMRIEDAVVPVTVMHDGNVVGDTSLQLYLSRYAR
ncbi:hypothetical protein JW930_05270 [Candidatus Woesearchaeota archaeon]|nr:hypothetical protein [Candidatus Woesearchaeota archaeon]